MSKTKQKYPIDWLFVQDCLEKQSTGIAIASMLGISKECLYERVREDHKMNWSEYKMKYSAIGVERLRHKLYEMAMVDKIPSVAIFLSKNLLGYADKVEQQIEIKEWKAVIPGVDDTDDDNVFDLEDMD